MTTLGDISLNSIGRIRLAIEHQDSTVSGLITGMEIYTAHLTERDMTGTVTHTTVDVQVSITLGTITLGPLDRTHPCQVIA